MTSKSLKNHKNGVIADSGARFSLAIIDQLDNWGHSILYDIIIYVKN